MTFAQPFTGYEILARVGAGAMGTVFRARQKHMDRVVALKVLRPSLARNEKYVERLRREARIVGALNHPNIVTGYDLGEEGGYHFFVMEFIDGQSLRALLSEWGWFPEERVLDVGIQVAEALDHAFQAGVIHRDIKPGNILIDDQGRVKLTDMGLAKGPEDMSLTRDGATVGTPQFISPEQARDPKSADVRSDLYSLGATLFQMATGSAPFSGATIGELIHQVLHEPAPSARDLNPQLSDGLSLVIKKLLVKDPALRYQTPAELLEDLRRVQRDERPVVDVRRIEKAERRHGVNWWRVAGVTTVGAVILALAVAFGSGAFEIGAGPGLDGDRELARQLASELEATPSLRDRFRICERARGSVSDAAALRVVDLAEQPLREELRDRILTWSEGFLQADRIDSEIRRPESWRNAPRTIRVAAAKDFTRATGFRPDELPVSVRATWSAAMRRLDEAVAARADDRDRQYFASFVAFLDGDVERAVTERLADDRFEAARGAIPTGVAGYHGEGGRPELVQLGDVLRARLDEAERAFTARWGRRIDEAERSVADDLRLDVANEIDAIRRDLERDAAPGPLAARLAQFRLGRLPDSYPDTTAFSRTADPWKQVDRDLDRLQRDLDGRIAAVVLGEQLDFLAFVYRVVPDASVESALELLRERVDAANLPDFGRHQTLLESAASVRRSMLGRLASQREVFVPGGQIRVTPRDGGGFDLSDADTGTSLPFAVVAAPLLRTVPEAAVLRERDDATVRAGLAFWNLFAGNEAGVELLSGHAEWKQFLVDTVAPLVRQSPVRRFGASSDEAQRLVAQLVRAETRGDVGAAEQLLARLAKVDARRVSRSSLRQAERIRSWVREQRARDARARALRAAALPTAIVEVDPSGAERVRMAASALARLDLHESWRVGNGALSLDVEALTLDQAWQRRLELELVVGAQRGIECELELVMPDRGELPRAVLFSLRGANAALVALPNGAVVAGFVEAGPLRDATALRRAFAELVGSAVDHSGPWLVPGARHRVVVQLTGSGRTKLLVSFDGQRLCDRRVQVTGDAPDRLVVIPFQPVGLYAVSLAGHAVE